MKIISLLPAATELLLQLNAEQHLIACTHACDLSKFSNQPKIITKSNVNSVFSDGIDAELKTLKEIHSPVIWIDEDFIINSKPDLIIAQTICDVCAIDAQALKLRLLAKGIDIPFFDFNVDGIADFISTAQNLGKLLKISNIHDIVEDWETRVDIVQHKIKLVQQRERLLFLEWTNPLMVAGHWNYELVERGGAIPILSKAGEASFYISFEDILRENPDMIIIAPCGFNLAQGLSALGELAQHPEWNTLAAVQQNRVFVADGNRYFNNPGPAMIDSVEILAEMIQANQFYFGFEAEAWVRV